MVNILIIDDEEVLLDMLAELIEELGYKSITATSGHAALAVLNAESVLPSLVISDVMMPQMNGVELVQQIRAESRFTNMPIVLMSAGIKPTQAVEVDYFLHKPFSIDQIADLIAHFVATPRATATLLLAESLQRQDQEPGAEASG